MISVYSVFTSQGDAEKGRILMEHYIKNEKVSSLICEAVHSLGEHYFIAVRVMHHLSVLDCGI